MDIVKIAVLGIAGVFLAIPLKREKGEYSTFVAMVVGICIFIYLLTKVETVLLFVDSIKSQLLVDSRYIGLVVRWWESRMCRSLRRICAGIPVILRSQDRLKCLQSCPFWW